MTTNVTERSIAEGRAVQRRYLLRVPHRAPKLVVEKFLPVARAIPSLRLPIKVYCVSGDTIAEIWASPEGFDRLYAYTKQWCPTAKVATEAEGVAWLANVG